MSEPGLVVYRFGAGIFYANAARLSDEVLELAGGRTPPRWLVLDAPSIDDIDFTGGKTLVEIAKALQEIGVVFAVADVRNSVRLQLDRYGVTSIIGEARIYDTVAEALEAFHAESPTRPAA
jgi:MFS superfamily sulfate permease-like transporter